MQDNGTERIVAGLYEDAELRAGKLVADAEQIGRERIGFARQNAESIRREASEKAESQAVRIRRTILSGIAISLKRKRMQAEEELQNQVIRLVRSKIASMIPEPGYRPILRAWIVEALVGLGAERAEVNASAAERALIDEPMLRDASAEASERLHHPVRAELSGDLPLEAQGVVATAADRRTAYNNQISTRLLRMDREIRNLMHRKLQFQGFDHGDPALRRTERT